LELTRNPWLFLTPGTLVAQFGEQRFEVLYSATGSLLMPGVKAGWRQ